MEMEKVIFRVWKNGHGKDDVIALFPDQIEGKIYCGSYMHIGQHGAADYGLVIKKTRPAKKKEYADLKKELESIGYKLNIRERR